MLKMKSIFERIDNSKLNFLGFNPLGALKNISIWRRYIFLLLIGSTACWAIFGWESTWSMAFHYIKSVPSLIFGQTTLAIVQTGAAQDYGIGQHFSSAVIYGITFLLLSFHLEKVGIKKSLNFAATVAFSFMSVGIYEIIYNILYSNLQNQPWTFSLQWQQGLNITMFFFFAIAGAISLLYLYTCGYRPNFSRITQFLLLGSILTYCLWIFYPLPTTILKMETTTGTWQSGSLFPQTMYAVDTNPLDGIAVGTAIYVQNDFLHFVNILNKVFISLTVLSFVMVRRKTI